MAKPVYTLEGNANYAPWVAEVTAQNLISLPNSDNLVGIYTNGYQAIVSKDTKPGSRFLVFPAEVQLSDAFVSANNLYRHPEKNQNQDPDRKGYLEDNRRVRAITLRGNRSDALALSLTSLSYLGIVPTEYPALGESFDTVGGVEISRKYEPPLKPGSGAATSGKTPAEKAWKRVDAKFLPEHPDTENWFRNEFKVPEDAWVTVTQKVHGCSVRMGHTIVKRKPTWKDRLAARFGVAVKETEFDFVFGSRKVIKDPHNPNQAHYYSYDLWSDEGSKYEHLIPKNVVLYGELIGWTKDGAPIQQNYTYDVPARETHLYVYRVSVVTEDGGQYDLSRRGLEEFCRLRGLNVVPLLWQGFKRDFVAEDWLDKVFHPTYSGAVPLSNKGTVDEGVVIQYEGVIPFNLKAKSPIFLRHETKILDTDAEVLS